VWVKAAQPAYGHLKYREKVAVERGCGSPAINAASITAAKLLQKEYETRAYCEPVW
jgi:hypothetical protein